jgi:hypothetical protein
MFSLRLMYEDLEFGSYPIKFCFPMSMKAAYGAVKRILQIPLGNFGLSVVIFL